MDYPPEHRREQDHQPENGRTAEREGNPHRTAVPPRRRLQQARGAPDDPVEQGATGFTFGVVGFPLPLLFPQLPLPLPLFELWLPL